MKILFLIPALTGAGAEKQSRYLAEELHRRGHSVILAHIFHGPGQASATIPLHRFEQRGPWNPLLIADISRLIRSWRPDVVQTCIRRMDVAGGIAAALAGTPWVIREPNVAAAYAGFEGWLRLRIARMLASAVVANSSLGASYWQEQAPRLPVRVIRNGVRVSDRSTGRKDRGTAAVGIYTGRLEPQKNVDIFLRAAAEVMTERALSLVICGDGSERGRLMALAQELGIAASVRFTGFVEDVAGLQRDATFAVQLSTFEGQPNAVAECFAAGTPVILSDILPHREMAGHDAALFAALRDVGSTANAIRNVLDPPLASALATRAREIATGWSIATMCDQWEAVYESIIPK